MKKKILGILIFGSLNYTSSLLTNDNNDDNKKNDISSLQLNPTYNFQEIVFFLNKFAEQGTNEAIIEQCKKFLAQKEQKNAEETAICNTFKELNNKITEYINSKKNHNEEKEDKEKTVKNENTEKIALEELKKHQN